MTLLSLHSLSCGLGHLHMLRPPAHGCDFCGHSRNPCLDMIHIRTPSIHTRTQSLHGYIPCTMRCCSRHQKWTQKNNFLRGSRGTHPSCVLRWQQRHPSIMCIQVGYFRHAWSRVRLSGFSVTLSSHSIFVPGTLQWLSLSHVSLLHLMRDGSILI